MEDAIMKTYTFPWSCDAAYGDLELAISKNEVELIKKAYRDAFDMLSDVSYLSKLQKRAVKQLDFYEPDLDQDIRILFPEEITKEVDDET